MIINKYLIYYDFLSISLHVVMLIWGNLVSFLADTADLQFFSMVKTGFTIGFTHYLYPFSTAKHLNTVLETVV